MKAPKSTKVPNDCILLTIPIKFAPQTKSSFGTLRFRFLLIFLVGIYCLELEGSSIASDSVSYNELDTYDLSPFDGLSKSPLYLGASIFGSSSVTSFPTDAEIMCNSEPCLLLEYLFLIKSEII